MGLFSRRGCQLPWKLLPNSSLPVCQTQAQMAQAFHWLNEDIVELAEESVATDYLSVRTECLVPCSYIRYVRKKVLKLGDTGAQVKTKRDAVRIEIAFFY